MLGLTFWISLQEEDGCSMLQMEKNCRTHLEVMKEHKKQRMEELKGLIVKDRELCDVMCTTPFCINQDSVPSLTQLESYRAYVDDLTKEKVFLIYLFVSLILQFLLLVCNLSRHCRSIVARNL